VVSLPWSVAIPKYFFPFARNFASILPVPPVLEPTLTGPPVGLVAGGVVETAGTVAVESVVGIATAVVFVDDGVAVPGIHCE
jgi:hypothetical protein